MSNPSFRKLTLADKAELRDTFAGFPHSDIHCDPRYMRLFEQYTGQCAVYVHYRSEAGEFLVPFFERELTGGAKNEKDIVSPWYYGGTVHTFASTEAASREFPAFLRTVDDYCKTNGIVSEFQRLNPMTENHRLHQSGTELQFNRKIVYVDLSKTMEEIRGEYEYKARKNIKRAQASGLRVVIGANDKTISAFVAVYAASMERKVASDFYHFDGEFFADLFGKFPDEAQLFTVYAGEEVVAASLVLGNGVILHDYLRAAYPAYSAMRPNDLVIDYIIEWAKGAGYSEYSLGGGHAVSGEDSLFRFKKSFSNTTKDFYVYKKIHDRAAYESRCVREGIVADALRFEESEHFPEYQVK